MLYLASQSPRRKVLLKKLGIRFKILIPKVSEELARETSDPKELAIKNAKRKVESVAQRVKRGIILGVDTIVVYNKKILGKPRSKAEAKRMLKLLSGKRHLVISGIFLLKKPGDKIISDYEVTEVTFRPLRKKEIEDYINTKEPYDKAGAYAIQGRGGIFIERIEGCYQNVIGLPLPKILRLWKKIS